MFHNTERSCCHNCEHLRIDNFCMVKGKYILSRNIYKNRDCEKFSLIIIDQPNPTARCESQELVAKLIEDSE